MQRDAEGCRGMQRDAEGCRRMQKDAEGCRGDALEREAFEEMPRRCSLCDAPL